MPRIARGLANKQIYHVFNRGNGKQKVFHKEQDYAAFIKLMSEAKKRYPLKIFAYCLMPNHFHLVLMPEEAINLSKWMHWLMTSHVRRYHKHYETSGHIWQGRFKSSLIQQDEHLLIVLRYVEGNPVRAGLVSFAKEWQWSSHNERIEHNYKLVDEVPVDTPEEWRRYVDTPLTDKELEKLRQKLRRQSPFGDEEWTERISKEFGLESTIRPIGRPRKEEITIK